jgi:toxin YoeB
LKITWLDPGWDDYVWWLNNDVKMLLRINEIIKDTRRNPFTGLGKPEPLRNVMSGWWARRITQEHRLVYRVVGKGEEQALEIVGCRFHYSK